MCKGKETDSEKDHLHYPAALRNAARLLGYNSKRDMGILLAACTASGLDEFGRAHGGFLVKVGACTEGDARRAQQVVVEFAETMMERLRQTAHEGDDTLDDSPI